ncbi:unnamed protein product [Cuscuta epithymum]|uniref:Secreted protein n=1 Tax=Cuscuta epithymum TaxID=186058 RepID=A0AAV0D927_9ASTE|nr:unnamed protein product [Cuscuta epithymum]
MMSLQRFYVTVFVIFVTKNRHGQIFSRQLHPHRHSDAGFHVTSAAKCVTVPPLKNQMCHCAAIKNRHSDVIYNSHGDTAVVTPP